MDMVTGSAAVSAVSAATVTVAGAVGHWVRLRCRVRHTERLARSLPPGSLLEEVYEDGGALRLSIPPAVGAGEPGGRTGGGGRSA
jgi:hypothetical protein